MTETKVQPRFVSGFVTILGRPNAGKSTLLNALVGSKVAIVADKPQTTRTSIQGVLMLPEAQVVFLDTPGIHKPDTPINKRMMESVRAGLNERDLLLFVVDLTAPFTQADRHAVDLVERPECPVILVLNKLDALKDKQAMLPLLESYRKLKDFDEYLPISAVTGEGMEELRAAILSRMPEGPEYFPPGHITDQPERFLASELIREKLLHLTRQEVPHSVAVMIDRWEETEKITRILATIYVEKDGQKGIVIGAGGGVLKQVGTESRKEMELLFDCKIFLELHVKVKPRWRENPAFLNALDWRTMAGTDES